MLAAVVVERYILSCMEGRLQFAFPRLTPFVKKLLIVLVSAFVAVVILDNWVFRAPTVFNLFALSAGEPSIAAVWQVLTYALVEPADPTSVLGLLVTLVFIWLILGPFEESFGQKRTFQLTIFATLFAGVCALAAGVAASLSGSDLFVASNQLRLFGAGPLTLAGISAFAAAVRGDRIHLFGLFAMKPMHLIWLTVAFSLLMFLASRNPVTFAADLGAIASGYVFVRWLRRPRSARPPKRRGGGKGGGLRLIRDRGDRDREEDDRPRYLN